MHATAQFLANLRAKNERVSMLPADLHPADLAAAYAVQKDLVNELCSTSGSDAVGYKIALSSPTAQALCNVTHPVYARLIGLNVYESGVVLEAKGFGTRIIEVEFGFRLCADVPREAGEQSSTSIRKFVDLVYPSIEIVDHHYGALEDMTAEAIIADNGIHGAWVYGAPVAAGDDLADVATALHLNGQQHLTGAGNRTLGDPWAAIAWLANTLHEHGSLLKAGDKVTTGLTTDGVYDAKAGDEVIGDFGALGTVSVQFT